jgi:hypothetical protein
MIVGLIPPSMGATIDALGVTGDALRRNPVLVAGAAVLAVGTTVSQVSSNLVPLLGGLVGLLYFFVEPLFTGGYLGMANQAVDGRTNFDAFVQNAKDNYLRLLGARLLLLAVFLAFGIVLVIVSAVVGAGIIGSLGEAGGGADPGQVAGLAGAAGLAFLGIFLVAGLLFLVAAFLLQFYEAAIVLADAGVVESFKYSYRIVADNVVSALGYSLLVVVVSLALQGVTLVAGGGGFVLAAAQGGAGSDPGTASLGAGIAIFTAVTAVVTLVSVTLLRTYYVAFVRSVTGTV